MKKILFILFCIASIGLTIFLIYRTFEDFSSRVWYDNLLNILAIVGWCVLTEKVINKKYKWIQKFFD